MKRCMIVGRPNVGKTLFAIRFAEHLGLALARISFAEAGGRQWQAEYSVAGAERQLTSATPHHTRQLQAFALRLPAGKGRKQFELVDTSGLSDGIHPDESIRLAMAQTLRGLLDAQVVLHMMDAAALGAAARGKEPGCEDQLPPLSDIDVQVARYGASRGGYLLLANKMDLPEARAGLTLLRQQFSQHPIAPISALRRQGFDEVKAFVRRHL